MTSPFPPLADLLTEPQVAELLAETGPWWLWTADAARLIATNSSGARAMGATGVGIAIGRAYSPTHAFAGQVRRLAEQAGDGPRQDRLRVFGRFGSESAVAEIRAIVAGGERLVALRLTGLRRGAARDAALAFVNELPTPALIFAEDGAALGASAPAAGVASLPLGELIGPEHARVTTDLGRNGRASVALVNGAMMLVRVASADVIVALLPSETAAEAPAGLRLVALPTPPVGAEAAIADETEAPLAPAGEDSIAVTGEALSADERPDAVPADTHVVAEPAAPPASPLRELAAAAEPADEQDEPVLAGDFGIPARFSWRMDASLRFHAIEPSAMAAPAGLTFGEASERFGLDPDGQLDRAVMASRPFSGVPAVWPLGAGPRRVAVTLAAFPTRRDGASQGYAGFGLVVEEVAQAVPAAPLAEAVETATSDEAADDASATDPAVSAIPAPDAPDSVAADETTMAQPIQSDVEAAPVAEPDDDAPTAAATIDGADASAAILPDSAADEARPGEADQRSPETATETSETTDTGIASAPVARDAETRPVLTVHTNPPNVVALRSSAGIDPRRSGLSPGERNAFREIARALGARAEGDDGVPALAADPAAAAATDTGTPRPQMAATDEIVIPAEAIAPDLQEGDAKDEAVAPAAAIAETPEAPAAQEPANVIEEAEKPVGAEADADETAEASEPDAAEKAPPAAVVPPPMAQQRSMVPPAFLAPPPIVPADEPASARDFVDSGTPFGPLPSAFGATPGSGEAPALQPAVSASPAAPQTDIRALLDRVPVGLVVHRGNQVLFANRSVLDWVGFADAGALERAGGIARLFAGDRSQAEGAGDHVTLTALDGSAIPVEARLSKTSWNGEPAFLFTLRRPETDADAESETATLAELRGRLDEVEQILDTATDGIVIVNADASIESMNRSAEALFGYESAEMKGRSVTALFAPESHRSALDYCDGLLSNGVASILNDGRQIIGRVKQGGLIPLYMTMGRTGPDNRPKLAAVFRDMTQWKKAEEDLVAAKRQAEQASSQKSDFLAKISHEIRTPLNAIIGFSEVMMEERFGPVGNERYRDYLKDIHLSGGHVLSLINDLLDLSKIEAGKLELSFTSVDLNDVIQSTVAIMQPQANRERVIIRSSLQSRLPNVVADSRSLRQIVLNLLSNSVKFTPAGGQIIVSTALSDAGEAVLRVRDTGVGMTEPELRAAMEPFRQVATSNPRATKGTGLGLPLTKALVEANRASFGISSTPNQGTLVEVVFPPTRVLAE
jgi:PAS domain S-box-containing protein